MCIFLASTISWACDIYMWFLIIRIIASWFPDFSRHQLIRFLAFCTDPYLKIFRRIIPPFGNLDLSPMIAFLALSAIKYILLILLSYLC